MILYFLLWKAALLLEAPKETPHYSAQDWILIIGAVSMMLAGFITAAGGAAVLIINALARMGDKVHEVASTANEIRAHVNSQATEFKDTILRLTGEIGILKEEAIKKADIATLLAETEERLAKARIAAAKAAPAVEAAVIVPVVESEIETPKK